MRLRYLFMSIFSMLCVAAHAQSVGLVLSGGGAKGLYHIGIIKALEENNIPIDYISGTSIGAIIGGLYAAGYSPDDMAEIFSSPDINNWVTGQINEKHQYYFNRMRESASMVSLRFGHNQKGLSFHLPSNFVSSDQLDMAFIDFFTGADVAAEGDFDNLIVPFRCIGADARNQREVVFSRGEMGKAIRASMSIPFIFSPVKTDSALYYDGGLFNNFPWQVLKEEFNPDIIIGGVCTKSFLEPDSISLMDQVFMISMLHTDYNLPGENDILIERALTHVSSMDFSQAPYLIEQGYKDAMAQMEKIETVIARREDSENLKRRRTEFKKKIPRLLIGDIEITGLTRPQENYVRKLLRIERDGFPITYEKFRSEYYKILAVGDIEGAYPEMRYDKNTGYYKLSMNMTTKPSLKLMVGGNISSTALNQAYVGAEYRKIGNSARGYNLDGYFSAFHTAVSQRNRIDFFVESPFFLEYGGQINFYNYFRSNYGFLQKGEDVDYSKFRDHYGTISAGLPTSQHSVVNLRVNGGMDEYLYHSVPSSDDDKMDRSRLRFVGAKLELELKNFNYRLYPTYGVHQSVSAIYVLGREKLYPGIGGGRELSSQREWVGAKFNREQYFRKWARWFSLGYMVEGVITSHPSFHNEYVTNISAPAFLPTPHSRVVYMKEFRSGTYVAAGIMPVFHFAPNFYLKTNGYIFLPKNLDDVHDNVRQRLRYIFDASFVYQTMIGPVSLSLSQYDTKSNNWFITFNFGLTMFNPKGTFY